MSTDLEKRVMSLERTVAKQATIIETLEDFLENRWAEDAIAQHDADEEWFPASVVDALIAKENPIRVYRRYRNLNQARLAKICNTSSAYISQLETGNRKPGAEILLKLARALKVEADDLVD